MTKSIGGFSPNLGIENIMGKSEGPGAAQLPSSATVLPTDSVTSLDALHELYAPSWDRAMRQFLKPHLQTRELLIPGFFASRMRQARQELNEAARQKKSKNLRNAALLLENDEEMKELLDIYRNLLLQG